MELLLKLYEKDFPKEKPAPQPTASKPNVHEQFKQIYDADPELRQVLAKSDVASFSAEEKMQVIDAYM